MTKLWRRVGLIMNPVAGGDKKESLRAGRQVIERSGAETVLTGPEELGAAALLEWQGRVEICPSENDQATSPRSASQTRALARTLVHENLDALVVGGGDGTLADVAQVSVETNSQVPILGIGCGSTNVGRLITLPADRASEFDLTRVETWSPDCLLVSVNGARLGLAFNDIVIGYTVVGTIDGRRQDLDAYERMGGKLVAARARPAGGPQVRVTRIDSGAETVVGEGLGVGTVIFGFAEPRFVGKAIAGAVCLAALCGLPAGCLVCDKPLAVVDIAADALRTTSPIASRFVAFDEGMEIRIEGIEGSVLCTDGNPLHRLQPTDRVTVAFRQKAVTAVRMHDTRLE
jgi:NAD kinase